MSLANNIPKQWKSIKVSDIGSLIRGVNYKKEDSTVTPTENYLPVLRGNNINGELNFDDLVYVKSKNVSNQQLIRKGDIIFAMSSGSKHLVGKSAKAKTDFNGGFGAFCGVFRVKDNTHKDFVAYFFQSPYYKKFISEISKGTNINNLKREHILDLDFPLPPLSEQKAIVDKIEELLSDLENGKQQLQTAQQQLKTYRQSLLKWAFEGKLTNKDVKEGELPKGWNWVKTGEVIDTINNGYTPTKEFLFEGKGEIPFIKVYNLNFDGTLNFQKNPTFIPSEIHKKDLKRSICIPGDVLINIVGPPLGKVSIVTNQFPEWNINQAIVLFRPNEKLLSKYISFFLQNSVTINWLEGTSKATAGQWNVKVSTCRVIPIPLPPIKEQQRIVDELESKLTVCDKLEETISQSLQKAETLRQSILKKAFEGKLIS